MSTAVTCPNCGDMASLGTDVRSRMPGGKGTPKHGVRVPKVRWEAAMVKAVRVGTTVTEVINRRLEEFIHEPDPKPDDKDEDD